MLAKMISPPSPHDPENPIPGVMSQIETGAPPESSTRFNAVSPKKPIVFPSGAQKRKRAPSVPGIGRASRAENGRRKIRRSFSGSDAMNAICEPSGETARKGPSSEKEKAPLGGGGTVNRIGAGRSAAGPLRYVARTAIATPAAATSQGSHRERSGRAERPACRGADAPSASVASCSSTSRAVCHRSSGSLARHVLTRRSNEGGLIGATEEIGGGSLVRIADMIETGLVPSKAFLPVAIS